MIYAAIFLTGLAIMALAVLHRLYRLWRDELNWWKRRAERTHEFHEAMRRVRPQLYAPETPNTDH